MVLGPALRSAGEVVDAGEPLKLVTPELIQLHGGIGMTDEHGAGCYLERAAVPEATGAMPPAIVTNLHARTADGADRRSSVAGLAARQLT